MKLHSTWKSRTTRQQVTLEAFDSQTVVYRIKDGNKLTKLSIVKIADFLTKFIDIDNERT
jgi:hypothetical protein